MPFSRKRMSGEDYYAIKKLLKKGHVFLTITHGEMTNVVIPGKWSHGAMYVGEVNGIPMIVEAVGKGVITRPLVDFILEKDEVLILEPTFCSEEQMALAADEAMKQLGAEYDYEFIFSVQPEENGDLSKIHAKATHHAFYCVELMMWAYLVVVKNMPFILRKRMGEPEVTADDFANAQEHWYWIWDKQENGTTWG